MEHEDEDEDEHEHDYQHHDNRMKKNRRSAWWRHEHEDDWVKYMDINLNTNVFELHYNKDDSNNQ